MPNSRKPGYYDEDPHSAGTNNNTNGTKLADNKKSPQDGNKKASAAAGSNDSAKRSVFLKEILEF